MAIFKLTITTHLFLVIMAITGCNIDDNGPAIPENAIDLKSSNAKSAFDEAITAADVLFTSNIQSTSASKNVLKQIRETRKNSGQDLVAKATFYNNLLCLSGSGVETGDEQDDGNGNGSGSGIVTFDSCEIEAGIIIDGVLSFEYKWQSNGYWEDRLSGDITITKTDNNMVLQLSSLVIAERGNTVSGDYIISAYQFTYDPGSEGFSAQIGETISGNSTSCGPTSGALMINGGNGSRVRATFNTDTSLTLEVKTNSNSTFTQVPGNPFSCAI